MRRIAAIALLLVAVAACDYDREALDDVAGDDDLGPSAPECQTADDCVLAASTCCGCPEFATADLGWQDGCELVECPGEPTAPDGSPETCAPVAAACVEGACTVACVPSPCDLVCDLGFDVDPTGCQRCACAGDVDAVVECAVDADCVQIPGDCCGCARGGADTAAPLAEADARVDALGCPADPAESACPEVDVCDPSLAARCVAGTCVLSGPAPADDAGLCGRPDLPPCPEGSVCVLNADEASAMEGVGRCQPG